MSDLVDRTGADTSSLADAVEHVRGLLSAHREGTSPRSGLPAAPPAVDRLAHLFELSAFERSLLLLAATVELDGAAAELVAGLQAGEPRPTFALALALLPEPHWDAIAPASPLRRWRLLDVGAGSTLLSSPLRIDEHVLHHLTGLPGLDPALLGIARLGSPPTLLSSDHAALAQEVARTATALDGDAVVLLEGPATHVAAEIARELGGVPLHVHGDALPAPGPDLATVAARLDRDARFLDAVLMIETGARVEQCSALLGILRAPVVLVTGELAGLSPPGRTPILREVTAPGPAGQRELWAAALGPRADGLAEDIEHVSQLHRLDPTTVAAAASELAAEGASDGAALRRLARIHGRWSLEGLAQRVTPSAGWDDLVLPAAQLAVVRAIADHLRHRVTVHESWGFDDGRGRGLGLTALFAGESGTGKTLAAEVVAGSLGIDLYRVDLSATVSKYIGETEKNLRRLFDAADASGAVLLFDEADALFGKRSEVKDSHDRYANLEVAYLLQRMETYRGLAILTSNLRGNLDRAFVRRLRFIVPFPFPGPEERAAIWRRSFPPVAPLDGVDPDRLAALNVAGGTIRAIALGAAFAAAADGGAIGPAHILAAAEIEYAKTDRTLTAPERAVLS